MVTHLVFFNLKENAEGRSKAENASKIKRQLLELPAKIPELRSLTCGIDFNKSDAAWDFGLYTEFASREDMQVYNDHPDHVVVKDFIHKVITERAVVDYEN